MPYTPPDFATIRERMLRDAERVLFEELAYALSIPPESVGDYLRTHAQTTAVG